MGIEIERKFLVINDAWRARAIGTFYCQGYIAKTENVTVRVRIIGDQGFVTLKGKTQHYSRPEFEYPIPVDDAKEMMQLWCSYVVEKNRYRIPIDNLVWEVDEFKGLNEGLVIAEVELEHPNQEVPMPSWVGAEVSHQSQYFNSSLAQNPYSEWRRRS
jgi:adenylate cyclase